MRPFNLFVTVFLSFLNPFRGFSLDLGVEFFGANFAQIRKK